MTRVFAILPWLALLAACGDKSAPEAPAPRDPQVAQALDDPLLTDPDLASRNEAAAALTVESDGSLPLLPATPEAIAAARAEAAALVGGADRLVAPPAAAGAAKAVGDDAPEAHLAAVAGGTHCASGLDRSTIWAARLPAALPVYPRGATIAGAGSDAPGCKARVVAFTTPVPLDEVLAFYWTRAAALGPSHRMRGDEHAVVGAGQGLAFDLRARSQDGGTLVRLATLER
jgi:hypothetical protein